MTSEELIKILKKAEWHLRRTTGSHHHFVHEYKKGLVTVPYPKRDFPLGTLKSIEKQAGLKLRRR